ncbi:MAG TPA: alpha/beta hydrolase family protein [Armatimonadota bacterium]|nr:alpha/beta hydrolase family protein [Armatimonadota bacterium]
MGLAHVNFFSNSLQKGVAFNALLPDRQEKPGPYPVLYLLHGLSDDYTGWQRWTSIERYVRETPMIVVMPDGDRSFYCDLADGPQYEKAIIQDLVGFVDATFQTIPSRKGRCIGGLSMGGYGCMKLGLKFPEMFGSITGFSGAYSIYRHKEMERHDLHWKKMLGSDKARRDNDCFTLARRLKAKRNIPKIRFDCGVDDFLIEHNREFHAHLEKLGIKHEYEEFPGDHSWGYWDLRIQEALAFHCKVMGI